MQRAWKRASFWTPFVFAAGLMSGHAQTMGLPAAMGGRELAAVGVPPSQGRVLYDKSYWMDLSDFTVTGSAPAVTNGQIVLNSQAGSVTGQVLRLNTPGVTLDENIDLEVYATNGSGCGGQVYGFVAGKMSVSGVAQAGLVAHMGPVTSVTQLDAYPSALSPAVANPVVVPMVQCPAVGDNIRLVYSQRGNVMSVIYDDFNQGIHQVGAATDNLNGTETVHGPNASNLGIAMYGGSFTITHIRAVSRTPANANVAFVMDSKFWGYNTGAKGLRFADRLDSLGPIAVYGGAADRTTETKQALADVIAAKPKYIVMGISRNSVCNGGEPAATWQANYNTMVAQVRAAGIVPVHLLAIPETSGCDQSAANAYVNANFAGDARVDPSAGFNTATDVSGDGIHPNAHGAAVIANDILAAGVIAPAVNATVAKIPSSFETYLDNAGNLPTLNGLNVFTQKQTVTSTAGAGFHANLYTPASSNAGCAAGDFADDANFHYVCTAANTWKRVALNAF